MTWQFKRVQYVNRIEMNYLEIYVPARTLLTRRNLSSKHRQGTSRSALTLAEVWRSEGARHCFICRSPAETRRKRFTIYMCVCACACVDVYSCMEQCETRINKSSFFCLFYVWVFFLVNLNFFVSETLWFHRTINQRWRADQSFSYGSKHRRGTFRPSAVNLPPNPTHPPTPKLLCRWQHTWLSVQSNKPIVTVLVRRSLGNRFIFLFLFFFYVFRWKVVCFLWQKVKTTLENNTCKEANIYIYIYT